MRFVVARRLGRRGEGLGNEMLPWAKGFIASEALQAKLVGPSWSLNKRNYYRNFQTSRLDFVMEDLLRHLPHTSFTEADYLAAGEVDFGKAIQRWAQARGLDEKSSFIITVDGMYGGYPSIWNARSFLLSKLLSSRGAISNIYALTSQLDRRKLFVAVHMRFGGDFTTIQPGEEFRGKFNVRVPADWYLGVCEALKERFGEQIQFHFFTDRGGPDFEAAVRKFNPGQSPQAPLGECSDLALMTQADLRVCSVSSYSLAASFLSDGPYIWYEPQLSLRDGIYTLWGEDADQQREGSLTSENIAAMRDAKPSLANALKGYPMAADAKVPAGLEAQLLWKLETKRSEANLLEYGAVSLSMTSALKL